MVDFKPNPSGVDASGDLVNESKPINYLGTVDSGAVVGVALGAAFAQITDPVIDMEDVDKLLCTVDYVKSAGDDGRVRFLYGQDDDKAKLDVQEVRENQATAGEVKIEFVEHVLPATGRYFLVMNRLLRFAKIQFKSGGTPDANDKMAIGFVGQQRETP